MEHFIEFENSNIFKISSISLGILNILFFFSHIYLINKLNKNKNNIKNVLKDTSSLNIIFQLISSTLFFGLLNTLYIKNTKFLIISYLIGIVTSFEWYSIYIFYYHEGKIIYILLNILIPIIIFLPILLLFVLVGDFNKRFELILMHTSFIFYLFMFISPGFNIFKIMGKKNHNYIMILNSIIGIFLNIGMILFIICLNYYKILELYFITYPSLSLAICICEIIYYYCTFNKDNCDLYEMNRNFSDSSNDSGYKKISLVNRNSVEDDI